MATVCLVCGSDIKNIRTEKIISCCICDVPLHANCAVIDTATIKLILEGKNVCYRCNLCRNKKQTITSQMKELHNQVNSCMDVIRDQSKILDELKSVVQSSHSPLDGQQTISYSNVVKRSSSSVENSFIVKPIQIQNQQKGKAQKILKEKVDLLQHDISIDAVKEVSKGAVFISCRDQTSKQKLKDQVNATMGNDFSVEEVSDKKPKLIILGVEKDMIDKGKIAIKDYIVKQNQLVCDNEEDLVITDSFFSKKNPSFGNVVLETTGELGRVLLARGKIKINWQSCKVEQHVKLFKCFKCCGFNHMAKNCTNNKTCAKCTGNHDTLSCTSDSLKCINCERSNQKLNTNFNVCHDSRSKNCSVYKNMVARTVRKDLI